MIGTRLGSYEITAKLGAGGMGEVYRATDTKLGREVAIKVLPEHFTKDRERLARFEREARLLAQLNHPSIAAIYGLEEAAGVRALVLELVEGPTLAERMQAGPLPFNESLSVSLQIAQALEEAHDKGIIHRDLKPQNIKASLEGKVKVLDFGLAKAMDPLPSAVETAAHLAQSPTVTFGATMQGVILGTAAYMSPEQAKGMTVDKRADIWAFGVVLYEMLTGTSLFIGDSIPDTLARVLQREIDWSALPESTPSAIRQLLRRCLQRNPKNRLHDIADARLVLEEVARGEVELPLAGAVPVDGTRRSLLFGLWQAALLAVGVGAGVLVQRSFAPEKAALPRAPLQVSLAMPPELEVDHWRLAPDGSALIFSARRRDQPQSELALYRRRLDSFDSVQIPGTVGVAENGFELLPDGRWLDFVSRSNYRILRIPLEGDAPPLERAMGDPGWRFGYFTLRNGDIIVFLEREKFVRWVGGSKGTGTPLPIDIGRSGAFFAPPAPTLPGDRGFLLNFLDTKATGFPYSTALVDLQTGKGTIVVENGGNAQYIESGHLLFSRGPTLLGAQFDVASSRPAGPPVTLLGELRVADSGSVANFDLSRDGTLLYAPGGNVALQRRLIVVEPGEKEATAWNDERREFDPWTSSDGKSVFVPLVNSRGWGDLWRVPRDGPAQPLVSLAGSSVSHPAVSPEGRQLAFMRYGRDQDDGIYVLPLIEEGSPRLVRRLSSADDWLTPESFLADESRLIVTSLGVGGGVSVVELALDANARDEARTLIPAPARSGRVSRDEKWLAFVSDASGRDEVYLSGYRREGALGQRLAVSRQGGHRPRWSSDGRKLYFIARHRVFATAIATGGTVVGEPTLVADLQALHAFEDFQVLPDGGLLLVQKGALEEEGIRRFDLIFGFGEELVRRIP